MKHATLFPAMECRTACRIGKYAGREDLVSTVVVDDFLAFSMTVLTDKQVLLLGCNTTTGHPLCVVLQQGHSLGKEKVFSSATPSADDDDFTVVHVFPPSQYGDTWEFDAVVDKKAAGCPLVAGFDDVAFVSTVDRVGVVLIDCFTRRKDRRLLQVLEGFGEDDMEGRTVLSLARSIGGDELIVVLSDEQSWAYKCHADGIWRREAEEGIAAPLRPPSYHWPFLMRKNKCVYDVEDKCWCDPCSPTYQATHDKDGGHMWHLVDAVPLNVKCTCLPSCPGYANDHASDGTHEVFSLPVSKLDALQPCVDDLDEASMDTCVTNDGQFVLVLDVPPHMRFSVPRAPGPVHVFRASDFATRCVAAARKSGEVVAAVAESNGTKRPRM